MAKIRNITYGYKIYMGELIINSKEAKIVKLIFIQYLNGSSLRKVAEVINSLGICYKEDAGKWNKNIISRIIECDKYIGANGYPPIISEAEFNQANTEKKSRRNYKPQPQIKLEPQGQKPTKAIAYKATLEVTKLANEIGRELEKTEINKEQLRELIFKCAAEKYSCCILERS